jgi:hypothetical protein
MSTEYVTGHNSSVVVIRDKGVKEVKNYRSSKIYYIALLVAIGEFEGPNKKYSTSKEPCLSVKVSRSILTHRRDERIFDPRPIQLFSSAPIIR